MARRGLEGWHATHEGAFGPERWADLHQALHRDTQHVCFPNPWLPEETRRQLELDYSLLKTVIPGAYAFDVPEEGAAAHRRCTTLTPGDEDVIFVDADEESGIAPFFFAEGASVIAALALGAEEGDRVLDACAAPGDKSLVLACSMFSKRLRGDVPPEVHGRLVCNEIAKERAAVMQRSVRGFLPGLLFHEHLPHGPHVLITSSDPGTSSNTMERNGPYDKILFHAPCTSDRKLLRDPDKHGRWTSGAVKVNSDRQLKWLQKMFWMLKEGGVLLFCTAALAHDECDGVVERLIVAARGTFELEILPVEERIVSMVPSLGGESTDWGLRILPDRTPFGPLYIARIQLLRHAHGAVQQAPPF